MGGGGGGGERERDGGEEEQQKRSEIYTYEAGWHIYAMNWSVRRDKRYRLSIASLLEQYSNRVEIVQLDDATGDIRADPALAFDHPYPPTKSMFVPDRDCLRPDLLATSADFLRIWQIHDDDDDGGPGPGGDDDGDGDGDGDGDSNNGRDEDDDGDDGAAVTADNNNSNSSRRHKQQHHRQQQSSKNNHTGSNKKSGGSGSGSSSRNNNNNSKSSRKRSTRSGGGLGGGGGRRVELRAVLNGNRNSEFCGPLTSFDWNEAEPRRVGTSSIDTTCTIWDIEREAVDTQLIAHDKEVYDIAWGGVGVFASVSADGSVRVFDLRDKEHSTIIYESADPAPPDAPLVRLGWNKQDPRYMATVIMDSPKVVVLDIRFPTLPVVELHRHQAAVNAIAWAPHSSCHICTAGDDAQALIWDLSSMGTHHHHHHHQKQQQHHPHPPQTSEAGGGGLDPILAYTAGAEIEQLQWSSTQPDWVAIAFANKLQILRV